MRIFISSPFTHLSEFRRHLKEQLIIAGNTPDLAEDWECLDIAEVRFKCRDAAQQADLGLFLVGSYYGTVTESDGQSLTEAEYEALTEATKPFLVVIINDPRLPFDERQENFIDRIQKDVGPNPLNLMEVSLDLSDQTSYGEVANKIVHSISIINQRLARRRQFPSISYCQVVDQLQPQAHGESTRHGSSNEFSVKYDSELFVKRRSNTATGIPANRLFLDDFLNTSTEDIFFAISGRTGYGKTSLVCSFAEMLLHQRSFIPILLSCAGLPIDHGNLATLILRAISNDEWKRSPDNASYDLIQELEGISRANASYTIVIFLDAINELMAPSAMAAASWFNIELSALHKMLRSSRWLSGRVKFCLSCREEYWAIFSNQGLEDNWSDFIFSAPQQRLPSIELDKFSDEEFQDASKRYFDEYRLKNIQLSTQVERILREPVMLRYFCEAYGSRSRDLEPQAHPGQHFDSISRIEIFGKMVEKFRSQLSETMSIKGQSTPDVIKLTTDYILTLAKLVSETQATQNFSTSLVIKAAKKINHPDSRFGKEEIATSQESVFSALLKHGLIIEKSSKKDSFSFVFDSYYEFSLGRFYAFIEWAPLQNHEIESWVREFIASQTKPKKNHNEHEETDHELAAINYPQQISAIFYALLVVEGSDEFKQRRDEQNTFNLDETMHTALFVRLLSLLLESPLIWNQLGLAALRDSSYSNKKTWSAANDSNEAILDETLSIILEKLRLASSTGDHVIHHDLEQTLLILSRAGRTPRNLIISTLISWIDGRGDERGQKANPIKTRLTRICSANALFRLADDDSSGLTHSLARLPNIKDVAMDFWVARSLTTTIVRLFDQNSRVNSASLDRLSLIGIDRDYAQAYFNILEQIYQLNRRPGNKFSDATAIRSECASAMMYLIASDSRFTPRLMQQLDSEPSPWVWWRAIYTLVQLGQDLPYSEREQLLTIASAFSEGNPELDQLRAIPTNVLREKKLDQNSGRRRVKSAVIYKDSPNPSVEIQGTGTDGILVYHPIFLRPSYPAHPECRERLMSILTSIRQETTLNFGWTEPRKLESSYEPTRRTFIGRDRSEASERLILHRVHNKNSDRHRSGGIWGNYLRDVMESEDARQDKREGYNFLARPMELRPGIFKIAQYSAGAAVTAVDKVFGVKDVSAAWALNRPPGHLANNTICVLNNVACAAVSASDYLEQEGFEQKRIVVLDFDVHHGKHTQQTFISSNEVVYISIHADEDYSIEEGRIENLGSGIGKGYNFNLPIKPAHLNDRTFVIATLEFVAPIILGFRPYALILSCGYDGLRSDPLTPHGALSIAAYGAFARTVRACADVVSGLNEYRCRTVGTLEGGYSLNEIGDAHLAVIREFAMAPCESRIELNTDEKQQSDVHGVREQIAKRWALQSQLQTWQPLSRRLTRKTLEMLITSLKVDY